MTRAVYFQAFCFSQLFLWPQIPTLLNISLLPPEKERLEITRYRSLLEDLCVNRADSLDSGRLTAAWGELGRGKIMTTK